VLAFPGTLLAVLAVCYWVESTQQRVENSLVGGLAAFHSSVQWCRSLAWLVFWFCILRFWLSDVEPDALSSQLTFWSATIVLICSFYVLMLPSNEQSQYTTIQRLGVAATVCFFISLGPEFTLGHDDFQTVVASNPVGWAFEAIALFDALRGLSRFAIVVLCFLIVASIQTLNRNVQRPQSAILIVSLFAALMVFEGRQGFYRFVDETNNLNSETSQAIDALPVNTPLAQIPLGIRDSDAEAVLMTAVVPRPLINGHSGFAPAYYLDWNELMRGWNIENFSRDLGNIWPTPWIVLNHAAINFLSRGWRAEFPTEIIERNWELAVSDNYRSLYRPRELVHDQKIIDRWLRRDVLVDHPWLSFQANTDTSAASGAAEFRILVNDVEVVRDQLKPGWNDYQSDLDLSAAPVGRLRGDSVRVQLLNAEHWQVRAIRFHRSAKP